MAFDAADDSSYRSAISLAYRYWYGCRKWKYPLKFRA